MLVKLQGDIISSKNNEVIVNVINENDIEIENLNNGKFEKLKESLTTDDIIDLIINYSCTEEIFEGLKEYE